MPISNPCPFLNYYAYPLYGFASMLISNPCPSLSYYAYPLYGFAWGLINDFNHRNNDVNELSAECFGLFLQDNIFAMTGCLDANL